MKDSLFFPFGSLFDGCFRTQHRQKLVLNALMNSHASPAAMVPANREIVRLGLNLAKEDELAEAISPASEKFCQGLPIQRSILIPVRPSQDPPPRSSACARSLALIAAREPGGGR
jgi:hypothetical protein